MSRNITCLQSSTLSFPVNGITNWDLDEKHGRAIACSEGHIKQSLKSILVINKSTKISHASIDHKLKALMNALTTSTPNTFSDLMNM